MTPSGRIMFLLRRGSGRRRGVGGRGRRVFVFKDTRHFPKEFFFLLSICVFVLRRGSGLRRVLAGRRWKRLIVSQTQDTGEESLYAGRLIAGLIRLGPCYEGRRVSFRTRRSRQQIGRLIQLHIHYSGRLRERPDV